MPDDLLERRLGAALHAEGDSLPFTITAAELRRRARLRARGRLGRGPALLIAAAFGVGLIGLGALVGGWLSREESRPGPVPSGAPSAPTAVASDDHAPTPAPTSSLTPPTLPSLDAFLAPLDPARLVRAQALGPASAPTSWSVGLGGPGSTRFAPVTAAGSYRLYLVCLGGEVTLRSIRADAGKPADAIPITCGGDPTARDIGLAAGDAVALEATAPTSWRFALVAPDRPAPHATAVATDVAALAGRRLDNSPVSGDLRIPDYGAAATSPTPTLVTSLNSRDADRIALACAGPGPLTYELREPLGVSPPVGDGAALASVATTVECDGAAHLDVLRFPFATGADVWITAPSGTAWTFAGAWEDPPIKVVADGDGWGSPIAVGPNLELRDVVDTWKSTFPTAIHARLVITCYGGTGVDVTLRDTDSGAEVRASAACAIGRSTVTATPIPTPGRSFEVTTATHGPMWVSVAIQQAVKP